MADSEDRAKSTPSTCTAADSDQNDTEEAVRVSVTDSHTTAAVKKSHVHGQRHESEDVRPERKVERFVTYTSLNTPGMFRKTGLAETQDGSPNAISSRT